MRWSSHAGQHTAVDGDFCAHNACSFAHADSQPYSDAASYAGTPSHTGHLFARADDYPVQPAGRLPVQLLFEPC